MWYILLIILYLVSTAIAWGMYIARIRIMYPTGVFTLPGKFYEFRRKNYDAALIHAIAGPYSIWHSFKYERGLYYGLKWK